MANKYDLKEANISQTIDAHGTNSGATIHCNNYPDIVSVQIVWSTHTGTSTFVLQTSNNGSNWDTVAGTSTTTSGVSGSTTLLISPNIFKYLRLTITAADSNVNASYAVYYHMKNNK